MTELSNFLEWGSSRLPLKKSFFLIILVWARVQNMWKRWWLKCFHEWLLPVSFIIRLQLTKIGHKSKLGGGDNPMGTPKSQNQGPSPPKPDTYDRYKVFCLKDHILSAKKKRGPSNITFWIFRHLWAIGSHWEKRNQPIKMMPNELLSIDLAL